MSIVRGALTTLWENSKEKLTEDELRHLSGLSCHAAYVAENLYDVVEGVSCLVLNDESGKAGNFQSRNDFASLMSTIASQIDLIAGLVYVSGDAECRLQDLKSNITGKGKSHG